MDNLKHIFAQQVDEVVDAMAFIGKALHVDVVAES